MKPARVFLTTTCLLLLIAWLAAVQSGISFGVAARQHVFPLDQSLILHRLQHLGIFAIGWGVGVTGWLITGGQALMCLFAQIPRAWGLWREKVLTSSLPVYKYLIGGVLLLGLGGVLARQLWGIWVDAFNAGILAGAVVGAIHSLSTIRERGNQIDFLEANQRFINEEKTSLFTEYDKP